MKRAQTDVLICGAGAAGLTLAIELARRGIAFRIIDKSPEPFGGSRGKGIQPRTLEVFEDLGGSETPKSITPVFAPWHAMRSQAANFLRAVAGETTPLCTAADATKDLEIARDFLRLQQKGAGIKLSF